MSKDVEWGYAHGEGEIVCTCDYCGYEERLDFCEGPDFREAQEELTEAPAGHPAKSTASGLIFALWSAGTLLSRKTYEKETEMMMNYPNEWDLTLNGDTFNALKTDFNQVLRKTLSNMERKGSEAAELTVKLKIQLKKDQAPDFPVDGTEMKRDIVIPKFDHKVSSVMQIKDEVTGTLGGNYELVWDPTRGEWVMREIVDPQTNIFEFVDSSNVCDVYPDELEEEPAALEGRKLFSLPPASDEDEQNEEDGIGPDDGPDDGYGYDEPEEE